ncbi:LysR substrate-binding domain-containing protein [Craterilacuibacter sp. RT1T]|uniref:LysR substrate-binding domain-containing protein n=1 Tax=Craterilacuibacter sp. RT1T TaxID=2942211 RepID=UPI0020BEDC12|nr:LysR substrate-binding domain-containing protein [Craterilacuibacter sp. RT1T]MCL6264262.1 LysR substrate-binding domain-containing protein [Craterilacuibacter sp. RT1T]
MIIQTEALRVVETVARYRSFTAAAERLHKVPSAISYTVRKLEENIGTQLFTREGKQVELTSEGRYFLDHARDILRDLEMLQADITQLHGGVEKQLRIGLNNLLNDEPLAEMAGELQQRFPACQQSYRTEVYNGVWDALLDKRIDLALGAPNVLPQGADLKYLPMGEVHWDFVLSPQHPLAAEQGVLGSRELAAYPAISVMDTSMSLSKKETWLIKGQRVIYVPDSASKLRMLVAGAGISFMPRHLCAAAVHRGLLLRKNVSSPKPPTQIMAAWHRRHKGKVLAAVVEKLAEPSFLRRWLADNYQL